MLMQKRTTCACKLEERRRGAERAEFGSLENILVEYSHRSLKKLVG